MKGPTISLALIIVAVWPDNRKNQYRVTKRVDAFSSPPLRWNDNRRKSVSAWKGGLSNYRRRGSTGNIGGSKPPRPPRRPRTPFFGSEGESDDGHLSTMLWCGAISVLHAEDDDHDKLEAPDDDGANVQDSKRIDLRGGGDSVTKSNKNSTSSSEVDKASKSFPKAEAANNSSSISSSLRHLLTSPIRFFSQQFRGTKVDLDATYQEAMAKLRSVQVQSVLAPNSTLLPPDVVQTAAQKSGLIGNPLTTTTVQETARYIKEWYNQHGYVFHSVIGATLHPDNATAVLSVEEPIISKQPIEIMFTKEMVWDHETNQLIPYRKYHEKSLSSKRSGGGGSEDVIRPQHSQTNTTFVPTSGRTKPQSIARALQLQPGKPFHWDVQRWNTIQTCGIFKNILRATPLRMDDGTIQVHLICIENSPRFVQFGLDKSLYTGSWEGEANVQHDNLLGGGEKLGLIVRRKGSMQKHLQPSVRLRFRDDKFGLRGGYDVEVFNDYISVGSSGGGDHRMDMSMSEDGSSSGDNDDPLVTRKGVSFTIRNPLQSKLVGQNSISTSIERTSTRTGQHERMGSTTLNLGPFRGTLPFGNGRWSILTTMMTGAKLVGSGLGRNDLKAESLDRGGATQDPPVNMVPYVSVGSCARQVFPVSFIREKRRGERGRTAILALTNSLAISSSDLPHHESNALGIEAARVRGYSSRSNGPISSYIGGTTELRIPVLLPTNEVAEDGSVVLFVDYLFAARSKWGSGIGDDGRDGEGGITLNTMGGSVFRKSSVGLGLRASMLGVPVKYDMSYREDGKLGAFVSLGRDFNVQ